MSIKEREHFNWGLERVLDVAPFHYQVAGLLPMAQTDLSLHLHGDTGTGKEVIARFIHAASGRGGRFVAVNCAALPETLFESEMFGYRVGAFSGAVSAHQGAILSAQGGTLLLDEIGELSLPNQVTLLRVLETKEVQPLGAAKPVRVDFRLVSATLSCLSTLVREGRFRRDLFARLGQVFVVPRLRDRKEELGRCIQCVAAEKLAERSKTDAARLTLVFEQEAARTLVRHSWPYNIREVKQCVAVALASAIADMEVGCNVCVIRQRHLPQSVRSSLDTPASIASAELAVGTDPTSPKGERIGDQEILDAVRAARGNRSLAASRLGISERTIYRRLKRVRDPRPREG